MNIFNPKIGTWTVHSDKDPRWNKSGRGYGLVISGGPPEMKRWIKDCTEKYGNPPNDTTKAFYKD